MHTDNREDVHTIEALSDSSGSTIDECSGRVQGREPSGGGGGAEHTILPKLPKNCMTLKEFGRPEFCYVDPLMS